VVGLRSRSSQLEGVSGAQQELEQGEGSQPARRQRSVARFDAFIFGSAFSAFNGHDHALIDVLLPVSEMLPSST